MPRLLPVNNSPLLWTSLVARVGARFHVQRQDTAQIAREMFISEALACRALAAWRAERRKA